MILTNAIPNNQLFFSVCCVELSGQAIPKDCCMPALLHLAHSTFDASPWLPGFYKRTDVSDKLENRAAIMTCERGLLVVFVASLATVNPRVYSATLVLATIFPTIVTRVNCDKCVFMFCNDLNRKLKLREPLRWGAWIKPHILFTIVSGLRRFPLESKKRCRAPQLSSTLLF